jgi:beta-lactamase class D
MLACHRLHLVAGLLAFATLWAGCTGIQSQPTPTPPDGQPAPVAPATPVSEVKPELGKYFQGLTGAFVLYDLSGQRTIRYNPERCAARFLPASTFKIMNSLIGLETGVIPDEDYVIKWDGTQYDIPAWNQDHTLKTAIQNSVVWYYQELARRVGQERMQHYVDAAGYGNQDISGRIDTFWLEGGLRISAEEQVGFLKRLYENDLPFSQRSMDIVKDILVLEKTGSYQLSGKTGSVQRVAPHVGWFVGYLEGGGKVYIFATNVEDGDGNQAQEITHSILQGLGLLRVGGE